MPKKQINDEYKHLDNDVHELVIMLFNKILRGKRRTKNYVSNIAANFYKVVMIEAALKDASASDIVEFLPRFYENHESVKQDIVKDLNQLIDKLKKTSKLN